MFAENLLRIAQANAIRAVRLEDVHAPRAQPRCSSHMNCSEFIATAFGRRERSSSRSTTIAWYAGAENETATPTTMDATRICHTLIWCVRIATARKRADRAWVHCDALMTRRRSKRSAPRAGRRYGSATLCTAIHR